MALHRRDSTGSTAYSDRRIHPRWRRSSRSCALEVTGLEARRLLAGPHDYASEAVALPLDSPVEGTLAPGDSNSYRVLVGDVIDASTAGELTVTLHSATLPTSGPAFPARVSLVDANGEPLLESDGTASGSDDFLFRLNVSAGDQFIQVESMGAGGSYLITAHFVATSPAFQPVPSQFAVSSPLAIADMNDDRIPDLVAPDGIHLGVGDGTFQSTTVGDPLSPDEGYVSAIAVGHFTSPDALNVAFAELGPDGVSGSFYILQADESGELEEVASFPLNPSAEQAYPVSICPIDFGNGNVDLAVADQLAGTVSIFVNDGSGGFSAGQVLNVGNSPISLVAGRFGDGHTDLIVATQGQAPDPTNAGQGLSVYKDNASGEFELASTIPLVRIRQASSRPTSAAMAGSTWQ